MTATDQDRLDDALSSRGSCLFLSPHLDDAVLSCGALIEFLASRSRVTVATIFSESGPPPHTRAARSFIRQCSTDDAATLFENRRVEDREVLDGLGVTHQHLGAVDALFRRGVRPRALRWACRLLPELEHRYPTYRFDIARGWVSPGDRELIDELGGRVGRIRESCGAAFVFAPIGVGRHVDHLIVRMLGGQFADHVVYYSDFPYSQYAEPSSGFIDHHRLRPRVWGHGVTTKDRLIRGYRSQVAALFPSGIIPRAPETYFVPQS